MKRRVLVTGGGSGIGRAIATAFASEDYQVITASRSKQTPVLPGTSHLSLDVCDPVSICDAMATAGDIDIFIACAGGAETAPALAMSRESWDRMIALNLSSLFDCAQLSVPAMMKRKWGRFIAIGSTASLKGYRYASAYAAAKHGAHGFIRSLALEIATSGVTANLICPGYCDTPLIDRAAATIVARTGRNQESARDGFASTNPMRRLVAPQEVAAAALWLASDGAAAVNGQAIAIDGGESA